MKVNISTLILPLIFLFSCGQSADEKVAEAILSANIHLNDGYCDRAINELTAIGNHSTNSNYVKALASAYACRGGYNSSTFVTEDITLFSNPAVIGGTAKFSTSGSMDAPDNDDFDDIQLAIEALLYAGGLDKDKDPTLTRRSEKFEEAELKEINTFLMYLLMVNLGKYIRFYGNSSDTGVKGSGSNLNSSKCFFKYDSNIKLDPLDPLDPLTAVNLQDFLDAPGSLTGACSKGDAGHLSLGEVGSEEQGRMCQGVILLNNFLHVFPNVIAGFSGSIEAIFTDILAAIDALVDTASGAKDTAAVVFETKSYNKCMTLSTDNIQVYFATFYETLFR